MLAASRAIWSLGQGQGPIAFRLFSSIATIVSLSSGLTSGDSVQVKLPARSSTEDRKGLRPWLINRSKSNAQNTKLRLATKIFFSSSACMNFVKLRVFTL